MPQGSKDSYTSREDQDALLHYLMLLGHHHEARPPDTGDAAAAR